MEYLGQLTIIMRNSTLQLRRPSNSRHFGISNNIDQSDTIQADHFLKVDKATIVPVDLLHGNTEICAVAVGFHDYTPILEWTFGCRKVS